MRRKKDNNMIPFAKRFYLLLSVCLFIFLASFVLPAYSGDFKLKKINSHYEPELRLDYSGIVLPGTNIKAGSYTYIADNGDEVSSLGFLIDSKQFYFVESDEYDFTGDTTYGVYNGYFIIDSAGYGSTIGANHLMFLFKYKKESVQLLDVVRQAYIGFYGMDFRLINNEKIGDYWKANVKDIDGDGKPEIKLLIEDSFELYFEIHDNCLRVDLNPELYKPLFNREKNRIQSKGKSDEYYIYGFLSKKLTLNKIKNMTKANRDQSKFIITLLENSEKWNSAFHDHGDEKFVLKQYNLKRR